MNSGPVSINTINRLLAAGLLMMISPLVCSDAEDSPGWTPEHILSAKPWKEQQSELPAYPQKASLLDVNISTAGLSYELYIDPLSVKIGDDSVVRYTVVLISPVRRMERLKRGPALWQEAIPTLCLWLRGRMARTSRSSMVAG